MDVLEEVKGKLLFGLIGNRRLKNHRLKLRKSMVRVPWLIIMG